MTTTPPRTLDTPPGSGTGAPLARASLPRWVPWGVLAGAASVSAVLFLVLLSSSKVLFVIGTLVLFAAAIYLISRAVEGGRKAADRLVTALVSTAFALAMLPLLSVLITVVRSGSARFDAEFFTSDMRGVIGEGGGALHAITGTLLITGGAAVISVPIGIMSAIYLVEYGKGGRLARWLTFLVDVMTGIPSIVAGLFAFAFFSLFLGPGIRFGLGGAIALSVLMIPIVVRSTEEMLKLVPNELREAAYALGVPKWRTIVKVVIPTSVAGIATGVTISIARIIGETAPLLIIAGTTTALNTSLIEGRMQTLPVFTYYSYTQPGVPPAASIDRAWAAALTLMVIVMVLNLIARLISRLLAPKAR
jgi:phosphate transport system permease protein